MSDALISIRVAERKDAPAPTASSTARAARAAVAEIAEIRSSGAFVCDVAHIRAAMRESERASAKD